MHKLMCKTIVKVIHSLDGTGFYVFTILKLCITPLFLLDRHQSQSTFGVGCDIGFAKVLYYVLAINIQLGLVLIMLIKQYPTLPNRIDTQ